MFLPTHLHTHAHNPRATRSATQRPCSWAPSNADYQTAPLASSSTREKSSTKPQKNTRTSRSRDQMILGGRGCTVDGRTLTRTKAIIRQPGLAPGRKGVTRQVKQERRREVIPRRVASCDAPSPPCLKCTPLQCRSPPSRHATAVASWEIRCAAVHRTHTPPQATGCRPLPVQARLSGRAHPRSRT